MTIPTRAASCHFFMGYSRAATAMDTWTTIVSAAGWAGRPGLVVVHVKGSARCVTGAREWLESGASPPPEARQLPGRALE